MILFVDGNSGILFIKRSSWGEAVQWLTEIIKKNSLITIVLDKISRINGD